MDQETIRSTNVFVAAYVILFAVSVLLVSLDGKSLVTNFTAVAATFNNIGPGLEGVGPMTNFGLYSGFSKLVLTFDMLAGRLELFPAPAAVRARDLEKVLTGKSPFSTTDSPLPIFTDEPGASYCF